MVNPAARSPRRTARLEHVAARPTVRLAAAHRAVLSVVGATHRAALSVVAAVRQPAPSVAVTTHQAGPLVVAELLVAVTVLVVATLEMEDRNQ